MMDFGNFEVCPAIKEDVKEIVRFIQEAKDPKKEIFPRRIGEDGKYNPALSIILTLENHIFYCLDLLRDGFDDKQHFHCLLVKEKSQSTSSKNYC